MDIIYNIESIYNILCLTKKKNNNNNTDYLNKLLPSRNKKKELPFYFCLIFSEPIKIIDNLFIGDIAVASNWAIIRDYNFNHVINISNNIPNYFENKNIIYENINLDNLYKNIDNYINNIIITISKDDIKTKNKNNILIHSVGGTDSSVFIFLCILNYKYNICLDKGLEIIFNKLPNINLNYNNYLFLKNKFEE